MSALRDQAAIQEHHAQWDAGLQDWLDGDLDAAQTAAIVEHVESCAICRERATALRVLDAALQAQAPRLSLDAAFDRRILAQIETMDEAQRAAERQRAGEEFAANLRTLTRGWRRSLALAISGAIAGLAVAFALVTQLDVTAIAQTFVGDEAGELARNFYQLATMMLAGAGIGAVVARWLATAAD